MIHNSLKYHQHMKVGTFFLRITKQQQIGVGDNDEKWTETALERKFFTSAIPYPMSSAENRALERIFHERKYLSSAEASMLAFNLDIPTKKVVNWSTVCFVEKKIIQRTPVCFVKLF